MMNISEDALICDLAETYHIYDMRSLPLRTVATLSAGLREDSRIVLLASDVPARQEVILLATIADRLEAFRYGFSKDAEKGRNKPESIVEALYGESKKKDTNVSSFETAEDFEAALAKIKGD